MSEFPERYIGDGVYASFDGYHIILDLRAQDASRIALEPTVWDRLVQYREDILSLQTETNDDSRTDSTAIQKE